MDDKEMILSVEDWPYWPLLPMKRRGDYGWPDLGLLRITPEGYVFASKGDLYRPPPIEQFEPVNIDTLLAEGWLVD